MKAALQNEAGLASEFRKLDDMATGGQLHAVRPQDLEGLVARIAKQLSPMHYLFTQVLEKLATVCVSHAVKLEQMAAMMPGMRHPLGEPWQLRQQAVIAAVRAASVCECLAAGCESGFGLGCKAGHPPCPQQFCLMFHAGQDLLFMRKKRKPLPEECVKVVCKYFDHMFLNFGANDQDVCELVSVLKSGAKDEAMQASQYATLVAEALQASQYATLGGLRVTCACCGEATSGKLMCGRCKKVVYCSKTCQKQDWKKQHKNTCKAA